MSHKILPLTWALASLAAPAAYSAPAPTYCAPLAGLTKVLTGCPENEAVMGAAARKCLEKFNKEADTQTAEIKKLMDSAASASSGAQQASLKGSEANYAEAERRLGILMANGRKAVSEVDTYSDNLAMPEDFESAPSMGFTVEGFLDTIPCYIDNRRAIRKIGSDFMQKLNELEETRQLAESLRTRSGARKKGVGESADSAGAKVSDTKGKSAAGFNGSKPANGKSDITGVKPKAAEPATK